MKKTAVLEPTETWKIANRVNADSYPTAVASSHPTSDQIPGSDDVKHYGGFLVAESVAPSRVGLLAATPDLYRAAKAQHDALDRLLALVATLDKTFLPSKSGPIWDAVVQGHEAIKKAELRYD